MLNTTNKIHFISVLKIVDKCNHALTITLYVVADASLGMHYDDLNVQEVQKL